MDLKLKFRPILFENIGVKMKEKITSEIVAEFCQENLEIDNLI